MIDQILSNVVQYGVFAGLFVWLLYTTNKRNVAREKEYQSVIRENQVIIKEQVLAFSSMARDVKAIKSMLRGNRGVDNNQGANGNRNANTHTEFIYGNYSKGNSK